jgi:hypothetical protein
MQHPLRGSSTPAPVAPGAATPASATPLMDAAKDRLAGTMSEVSASFGSLGSLGGLFGGTPSDIPSASSQAMPSSAPKRAGAGGPKGGGQRPEDVPREELMHLCMKVCHVMFVLSMARVLCPFISLALLRTAQRLLT